MRPAAPRAASPALAPEEPLEVEVDAEHEREHDEGRDRQPPPPGDVPERGEEHGVDEQVGLGVEVAPEHRDPAGGARELPVGVVEHRLQLQQQRGADEVAAAELDRSPEPGRRRREHDRGRRHPQRQQREHDEVRERPEDHLAEQLGRRLARAFRELRNVGRRHRADSSASQCAACPRCPDGWSEVDDTLEREFRFDDFLAGDRLREPVAELAESENHHPDIEIHYNRVTLRWWTHTAGGVTDRDRELAARSVALS